MTLIATIHTTDIELMAELDVADLDGSVVLGDGDVDGGLELHAAAGPDAGE